MSVHVESPPRILSRDECRTIGEKLLEMVATEHAAVAFQSSASVSTTFARGRTRVPAQAETASVTLFVDLEDRRGVATTNALDDGGLAALVAAAEAAAREHRSPSRVQFREPESYPDGPTLYHEALGPAMAADSQAEIVAAVTSETSAAGLLGAGELQLTAQSRATLNSRGLWAYERSSYGEFSITARTPDQSGSGWAWSGYEDWSRVDVGEVVGRAVALARRTANAVAVEPGRYPVILEPAAVAALLQPITVYWNARWADAGSTVFSGDEPGTNKIGQQMIDRRLGMVSDPWDPERPGSVMTRAWTPIRQPVVWFENGVLKNLEYDHQYVAITGGDPVIAPTGLRLTAEGRSQTLEEMVASTRRGVWVNRLSNLTIMNQRTLLMTGTTRDGTFLIENGQITRPIRNFRFTESPFFVLNRFEAAGEPVRASAGVVAPRLKLGDFNFTSLTDAV